MTNTMTSCPDCFEGKAYPKCATCDGRGVGQDGRNCVRCEGAGVIETDAVGCLVCGGRGEVRRGTSRIREAVRYGGDGDDAVLRCVPPIDPDGRAVFEQDGHGATQRALRAYAALRDRMRPSADLLYAIVDYLIPAGDSRQRTIPTAAIVLRSRDAVLVLTGCSWGYGGEGPNGTAAILDDLEAFATYDDALAYVATKPQHAGWMLNLPPRS